MPDCDPARTGRIFGIQRFSLHDGAGIRTNVFLKGCPLRCVWCQNPEGIESCREPVWVEADCIMCGSCVRSAAAGGVTMQAARITVHPEKQEDFDALMQICPANALRWNSEDLTVDQVMQRVRRDMPFYAHGGGGITLSGGDPLAQPDFAEELLRACRKEGIHTAVETELHAPWNTVERMLPHTDMMYADLKLTDPAAARKYTGAGPERILRNLRRLLGSSFRDRIIVRTPLIPGITATEKNIAAIARFLSGVYPDTRYELLNYNPLAAGKYPLVGRRYPLAGTRPLTKDQVEHLEEAARRNGIRNLVREN